MKILDATAGFRGIWYQKNLPFVTFMDKREGKFNAVTPNMKLKNRRSWEIKPDVVSEWKDAPFPDDYFDMVIFDPPHLIWKNERTPGALDIKYSYLKKDNYKQVLKNAFEQLFRVLKPNGFFVLKWCDANVSVNEILKLCPYKPLYGSRSGRNDQNHWIMFCKYDVNMKLDELIT